MKLNSATTIFFLGLMVANPLYADDYLDAVESEANSKVKSKTSPNHDPSKTEHREHMEMELKAKLPSTYKFYTKLSESNKAKVAKLHEINDDISAISKTVFDLYLVQNK
ncbi:MAG: hypothetical protein OEZ68_05830 [Gammaproteobacteria bacterium]|nr:hypothetical protein [Gammaproteobacteria bacterium]MDH5800307.1 hypothetical protein [Gammaproteobacteria bacterium]